MTLSRRDLLHLVVASTAVAAVGACIAPQQFGIVKAGGASDLSVGEIKPIANAPVFIARDANGVYAMSTTCTHAGCDLSGGVSNSNISCFCHGSVFDVNGNVLRGPAQSPLVHYQVTI